MPDVESGAADDRVRRRSSSVASLRQEKHINLGTSPMDRAVLNLRRVILAGEHYRQTVANAIGLGTTESQALSYLAVHGSSGQSELARDLGLTSSALTALVDRLERQGVAERVRHPRDRRRTIVSLTDRGSAMISETHRWLAATLERVDPAQLDLVSAALATIAGDLSSRASGDNAVSCADVSQGVSARTGSMSATGHVT